MFTLPLSQLSHDSAKLCKLNNKRTIGRRSFRCGNSFSNEGNQLGGFVPMEHTMQCDSNSCVI